MVPTVIECLAYCMIKANKCEIILGSDNASVSKILGTMRAHGIKLNPIQKKVSRGQRERKVREILEVEGEYTRPKEQGEKALKLVGGEERVVYFNK